VIQITKMSASSAYNSPFGRSIKKAPQRGRLPCKNYLRRVDFFHRRAVLPLPGNIRPVASLAGCGRRLVKEHQVVAGLLLEGMAGRAANILMAALERKRGLLVIEERGLPYSR
jgi:hypothetical protein